MNNRAQKWVKIYFCNALLRRHIHVHVHANKHERNLRNIYRIAPVMKVDTDIITSISAILIGHVVIMYVMIKTFKTDIVALSVTS